MSKLKLDYHYDAGHGWIECNYDLLVKLGIEKQISSYSYCRMKRVYLEEDCDATLLLNKLNSLNIEYELIRIYDGNESFIRNELCYKVA